MLKTTVLILLCSFALGTIEFRSYFGGVSIPDAGAEVPVTVEYTTTTTTRKIKNMEVWIWATHDRVSDLEVRLESTLLFDNQASASGPGANLGSGSYPIRFKNGETSLSSFVAPGEGEYYAPVEDLITSADDVNPEKAWLVKFKDTSAGTTGNI